MMQCTLGSFNSSRTIVYWIAQLSSLYLEHAWRDPIVEPGEFALEGSEEIHAFFYCRAPRDIGKFEPCPEITDPIYALARDMIADSWIIEACDCLGGARCGRRANFRLIAYRWIDGGDQGRAIYETDALMGGEAVTISLSGVTA